MKFIIATIIFALDVWAIASIINSDESNGTKLIWILLVALLPVVGLIIWWFAGPKANYSS
ncbi:MAG TPA: PLD nuclease N-terminal domain-containing protein [Paracoccus sp. (in: a-proteobacteria)]|nr:PLD nuclease N-terminal domain-containing protein [Paracoccus sp. (in: a-proteobacteria)]